MGQAFRRASGGLRSPTADPTPSPSPTYQLKKIVDHRQPVIPIDKVSGGDSSSEVGESKMTFENVLEEKDPQFDAMLNKMVGRIQTKPGGKLEMGEILPLFNKHAVIHFNRTDACLANNGIPLDLQKLICGVNFQAYVVENYKRPLPKLRNTTPDSSRYEDTPTPEGTLNVKQLRHLILLHEGKAEDGPMDIHQIAEKFRVDVAQIQKILQAISLPPEDNSRQK